MNSILPNPNGIRRIGVLTSGGDAPGMNAAVRAVARTCEKNNIECIGIYRGYSGLIRSDVVPLKARTVNNMTSKGGTMLYTARCAAFKTEEGLRQGVDACKYLGIGGLITIGGDGTFRGAEKLANAGINTVAIPATIDNDIGCSHYSIGFDTAANTAIEVIDKLSDTMQSHERASVVEVMGHGAGHLAVYVGISVGATAIVLPEGGFDFERDILERIREGKFNGKHHFIIIVSEGVTDTMALAERIQRETGVETRTTILGHIQRGGSPSARDRVMASRMGHFAVEALLKGETNQVVCYRDSRLLLTPINEALQMKKPLDEYMRRVSYELPI
ncbi:MAG: ATP-dependent 6-phosphofructokinase [Clostridia bacterium]|nr:ATP-dependent 6-phosphofructokinase [Clostridia bacterium]